MNIEFNRNEDSMKMLLSDMRQRLQKIYEGGGKKAIEIYDVFQIIVS